MTSQWEAQVVGINYYPDYTTLRPLTAAAEDAEAIATQLEQYGYQKFRVQRLPSQLNNQKGKLQINPDEGVNSRKLREGIANLFNPPDDNPPETALFFFSGHGWRKTSKGKEKVFIATSDVLPDQRIYGIAISWLGKLIQESTVKKLIVWLDCCHSGELIEYIKKNTPTNKDYCIFTAARSYETAEENIQYKQGLFTRELLEGLNPSSYPDGDGIVDSHKLAKFIEERMAQTQQAPQFLCSENPILLTKVLNKCPYRSLSYFTEKPEDAQVFYGRTQLTEDLIKRIAKKERLIAVFGASGSGKSSLIRAGLLYQLKLGQKIAGSNDWVYFEPFTPSDDPLARLREVLAKKDPPLTPPSKGGEQDNGKEIREKTEKAEQTQKQPEKLEELAPLFKEGWGDQTPIILIIDQFEECFTMCDEEKRKAFIDKLTELIETTPNLQLIIGMRDDFRGRLKEFSQFSQQISKVNVGHLNRKEIQEAIEKPAEFVGLPIEERLKEKLINDVEDYPGSLPLLQYTLTELWNEARKEGEQRLRLETYKKLGGIEGTLEKRADAVFKNLRDLPLNTIPIIWLLLREINCIAGFIFLHNSFKNSSDKPVSGKDENLSLKQKIAKRIFLELTQVGDTFDTRRRVQLGDLVNSHHSLKILEQVTQELANDKNRLITRTQAQKANVPIKFALCLLKINCLVGMLFLQGFHTNESTIIIDVVHEALIRNWKLLGDWKQQYQAAMVIERRIEAAAQEWEERAKKAEDLLQESRLATAEGYLKSFSELGMLDGMAEEFIQKSIDKRRRDRWRRRGIIGGIMGVVALGAIISTLFALDANRQKTIAQLKEQAANVQLQLPVENTVSPLILALATVGKNEKFNENWLFSVLRGFNSPTSPLPEVQGSLFDALKTVREHNIFKGHGGDVHSVAFSPDGKFIVGGSKDGVVRLWDISGNPIGQPFQGHKGDVNSVAVSPDSKFIVSGGADGKVRLWERSGNPIGQPFNGHKGRVWSVAFSPDGQTIVSGGADGKVRLWERSGEAIGQPFNGHELAVNQVAFSPNGKFIVSCSDDNTVRLWDRNGKAIGQPFNGHGDWVNSVAFSPDSKFIVSGSADRTVRLWDTSGKAIGQPLKGHKDLVLSVAVSPNGKLIVSGSKDGTMRLWDTSGNESEQPFQRHEGSVLSVAVSPDSKFIVSGSADSKVRLWDTSGKLIWQSFQRHEGSVLAVAFSPNGQTIVSGGKDYTVRLWDRNGKAIGQSFKGHINWVNSIAFSPDNKFIVSSSYDKTVRLWDRNGNPIGKPFQGHKGFVYSVAFSPNSKFIVSGSEDKTVRLWDTSGNPIGQPFQGHKGSVYSVAFSPDSKFIVSGSKDGTVRLWDTSGNPIGQPFQGHRNAVRGVAFSPDSKFIVSGSDDNTVRLWDTSGNPIGQPFQGHRNRVNSVAFSLDGKFIVSGSRDKTVRLWRGGTWQDWVAEGCNRLQLHADFTSPPAQDATEQMTLQGAVETCLEYGGWNALQKAEFFVRQGLGLAKENGDIEGAKAKLKQAQKLDSNVNLAQLETEIKQLAVDK